MCCAWAQPSGSSGICAARRGTSSSARARDAGAARSCRTAFQSGRPGTPSVTYLSSDREVTYKVLRSVPPNVQLDDSPVGTTPTGVPADENTSTPLLVPAYRLPAQSTHMPSTVPEAVVTKCLSVDVSIAPSAPSANV